MAKCRVYPVYALLDHLAVLLAFRRQREFHGDVPVLVGHRDGIQVPVRDQPEELLRTGNHHVVGAALQAFPKAPEMRRHANGAHALRYERLVQETRIQVHLVARGHKHGHLRRDNAGHAVFAHKERAEERDSHICAPSFSFCSSSSGASL